MRMPVRFVAAGIASAALVSFIQGFAPPPAGPETVRIAHASVAYREPGDFLRDGAPVNGPRREIRADTPFEIMKRQVTRGEYDSCVAGGGCRALDGGGDADLPAVGASFVDAMRYAAWLSGTTGALYRLPTDREWAIAAGTRFRDDAYTEVSDPKNPSKRWLALYDAEAAGEEAVDPTPRPAGAFGANERGLLDMAGNVWEWTSTCFVRHRTDSLTGAASEHENCGIRIAEGRHRAYLPTFIRDPKAGACSVGLPPANLGMRLVREERSGLDGLRNFLGF